MLRCSSCSGHRGLDEFDQILGGALSQIANVEIDDLAWTQANLHVGAGGLGIRSVALLAPSAFLVSAAATRDLQSDLLPDGGDYPDSGRDLALAAWMSTHDAPIPEGGIRVHQKSWDRASVAAGQATAALIPTIEHACLNPVLPRTVHGFKLGQLQPVSSAWTMNPYESLSAYDWGCVYVVPTLARVVRWLMLGAVTGFRVVEVQADRPVMLKSMTPSTGP